MVLLSPTEIENRLDILFRILKQAHVKSSEAEYSADGGTADSAHSVKCNVDCDNHLEPETKEQDLSKVIELKVGSHSKT